MSQLAHNWWVLAIRGAFAIAMGILAIFLPGITLVALVLVFGAYCFADGITMLVAGFRARGTEKRWWALLIQGLLSVLAGVVSVIIPLATALALVALVAAWAILTGGFEIAAAIRLRREIKGEWLLILSGALALALGVALVLLPAIGMLTLAWMVGGYLISSGVVLLALAFRLRAHDVPVGGLRPRTAGA